MASIWMIGINLHTWQVVVQEKADDDRTSYTTSRDIIGRDA
ncbi:hypothetical protein [Rhizobium acaciae]|nr:hypothetical protein [Rhizobium acaciae]MCW1752020.1 hypothetical protein [Rhizobium acaciae]